VLLAWSWVFPEGFIFLCIFGLLYFSSSVFDITSQDGDPEVLAAAAAKAGDSTAAGAAAKQDDNDTAAGAKDPSIFLHLLLLL